MPARCARYRAWLGLLAAVVFCVFIVEQAPHLVHHFFEPDQVQPECPFATAGDRQPGAPAVTAMVDAVHQSAIPLPPPTAPRLVHAARQPSAARAPPPFAS